MKFAPNNNDIMQFIYYNNCVTCTKAQKWLDDNYLEYEMRDIKEENPTYEELKLWHKKSGVALTRFFNSSGLIYKELKLKDKVYDMTEDELLTLLSSNGLLVRRPLLIGEKFVFVGFKISEWTNIL